MKPLKTYFTLLLLALLALQAFSQPSSEVITLTGRIEEPIRISVAGQVLNATKLPFKFTLKKENIPAQIVITSPNYEYRNIEVPQYPKSEYRIARQTGEPVNRTYIVSFQKKEAGKSAGTPAQPRPASTEAGEAHALAAENRPTAPAPADAVPAAVSDADTDIPVTDKKNDKTFAIVIGNENYTQAVHVTYALGDAQAFARYCQLTLGLPETNIRRYQDATFGMMLSAVKDMQAIAEAYGKEAKFIFYYAGHGVPNEEGTDAYLLPVDVDAASPEACYPLSRLYKELGEMGAASVTVFLDACFSGSQRGEGMLASARGVAIKPKMAQPQNNLVVFSAASGQETAYPYQEKQHGLFTYFLLKKLQETKGNVSLGELADFVTTKVKQRSIVVNRKSQTPTVQAPPAMGTNWKSIRLM